MDQSFPRISVVTPSLNQADFIGDTLESVLGQRGVQYEYLVLDGGSTDGTVQVIEPVADRLAFFRSCPDRGQAAAINEGFARSKGDILCWLNSDDMLLPGTLAFISQSLDPAEPQLIFGNYLCFVQGRADSFGSDVRNCAARWDLRYSNYIGQPAAFWTRRLWELAGPLDETLNWVFDWDWLLRAQKVATRFEAVNRYLAVYRIHKAAKFATLTDASVAEVAEVLRRHAGEEAARVSEQIWTRRARISRWNMCLRRRPVRRLRPAILRHIFFRGHKHLTDDQLRQTAAMVGVTGINLHWEAGLRKASADRRS
jgi:glycosyltransferase involved in cell wall biosynthesis